MAELAVDFFAAADSRDPRALLPLLAADVRWTFGNMPTVVGHAAVIAALTPFFEHVVAMSHSIVDRRHCEDCIVVETRALYRDRFSRSFDFPACNLLFTANGLIREVRIFVDNHELFVPP